MIDITNDSVSRMIYAFEEGGAQGVWPAVVSISGNGPTHTSSIPVLPFVGLNHSN